jgi:crotonobetainyl-CoA:carnitine CoA-transferase CaiB-like acyl-CoA transferase
MRHWRAFAEVVGEPRLAEKRFDRMKDRIKRRGEVEALFKPWLENHTRAQIFEAGQRRGLAFGYVASLSEVMNSTQHRARNYFDEIEHPVAGKHRYCGAPFNPSRTPWQSVRSPRLGEHNETVYCDSLGYSKEELLDLTEEGVI